MDKTIINIGRQLGSGGSQIAKMLAEEFGCEFYDRKLLNLAAKESGFPEEMFEKTDEHVGFLKSLFTMPLPIISDSNFYKSDISEDGLFQFQSDAIRKAAEKGSCVFVGRCADYVLRDDPHAINIFVSADMEWRANRVMERHACSHDEAVKIIRLAEDKRASYYNYYTGKRWGDSASYHLCINSSLLGLRKTADVIALFIREWKQNNHTNL